MIHTLAKAVHIYIKINRIYIYKHINMNYYRIYFFQPTIRCYQWEPNILITGEESNRIDIFSIDCSIINIYEYSEVVCRHKKLNFEIQ